MTLPPSMVEEVVQEETNRRKPASGVAETSSPGLPADMIERATDGLLAAEQWSSFWSREDAQKLATSALTAALGDKYVIVPREPDDAMLQATMFAVPAHSSARDADAAMYRAMIAARPGEDASAAPTENFLPSSLNPPVPPREPVE